MFENPSERKQKSYILYKIKFRLIKKLNYSYLLMTIVLQIYFLKQYTYHKI